MDKQVMLFDDSMYIGRLALRRDYYSFFFFFLSPILAFYFMHLVRIVAELKNSKNHLGVDSYDEWRCRRSR